jgi:hypothetical protein
MNPLPQPAKHPQPNHQGGAPGTEHPVTIAVPARTPCGFRPDAGRVRSVYGRRLDGGVRAGDHEVFVSVVEADQVGR